MIYSCTNDCTNDVLRKGYIKTFIGDLFYLHARYEDFIKSKLKGYFHLRQKSYKHSISKTTLANDCLVAAVFFTKLRIVISTF